MLHRSFGGMFAAIVHHESTPPLYYILAWAWAHMFGHSEAGVRSLSAVAGIATVWVVYLCARTIAGRRAALVAGLLVAVNPLLIWYSQEARSYALLAFFAALSFYLAATAVEDADRPRLRVWWWAITAALALCTHYFAVFFIVPEAAWLLWRRGRAAWFPTGAVLAVGLALLPLALRQRSTGRTDWITGTALHTRLALMPKQFLTGPSAPHQTLLALIALAGALAAMGMLVRERRQVSEAFLVAAGIPLAAPIAMGLLAIVGIDLVLTRNAIGVLPLGLIAVGLGVDLLARHRGAMIGALAGGAVAAAGLVPVVAVLTDQQYQRTDWRDAAHVLMASGTSHLVVLDPSSAELPLTPYVDLSESAHATVATREIDVVRFQLTTQGGRPGGRGVDPASPGISRQATSCVAEPDGAALLLSLAAPGSDTRGRSRSLRAPREMSGSGEDTRGYRRKFRVRSTG